MNTSRGFGNCAFLLWLTSRCLPGELILNPPSFPSGVWQWLVLTLNRAARMVVGSLQTLECPQHPAGVAGFVCLSCGHAFCLFAYSCFCHLPELLPGDSAASSCCSNWNKGWGFLLSRGFSSCWKKQEEFCESLNQTAESRSLLYTEDTCDPTFSLVLLQGAQVVKKLGFSLSKAF